VGEGEGDVESVVRFELAPDGDGSRLTLTHTFERVDDISGFGAGWHHHLELLDASVTGSPRGWDWERYRELKRDYESRPRA
jgi:Activator of Hsp90 ATPase homolog 1-like protein